MWFIPSDWILFSFCKCLFFSFFLWYPDVNDVFDLFSFFSSLLLSVETPHHETHTQQHKIYTNQQTKSNLSSSSFPFLILKDSFSCGNPRRHDDEPHNSDGDDHHFVCITSHFVWYLMQDYFSSSSSVSISSLLLSSPQQFFLFWIT